VERLALNLLEDIRVERRLVQDMPAALNWLRLNVLGQRPSRRDVEHEAIDLRRGRIHVACVVAGREHSGVVTTEGAERLLEIAKTPADERAQLRRIWETYAQLGESELREKDALDCVEWLAEAITDDRAALLDALHPA
jgi:hypothetical protein